MIGDNKYQIPPLIGLTQIAIGQSDSKKVEYYYDQFTELFSYLNKEDIESSLDVLSVYYMFALKNGNFELATKVLNQAISILESSKDMLQSSYYLNILCLLAQNYIDISQFAKASELIIKADKFAYTKRKKEVFLNYMEVKSNYYFIISQNPNINIPSNNNSRWKKFWHQLTGGETLNPNYLVETESMLKEIVKERRKKSGDKHIDYAISLKRLAEFYLITNSYELAKENIEKAKNIVNLQKENYINVYNSILFTSALTDFAGGKVANSIKKLYEFEKFLIKQTNENFALLSENQRETFISKNQKFFDLINSIYIASKDTSLYANVYNNILSIKSAALFSNQNFRESIFSSNNNRLIEQYKLLNRKREELEKLEYSGVVNQEFSFRILDSLEMVEKQIYKELNNTSNFDYFKVDAVNWLDLKKSLKKDEIAIEFLRLPENPLLPDSIIYYALLVSNEFTSPLLVQLFREYEVVHILNEPGNTKAKVNMIYSGESKKLLKKLIWEPIEKYLPESGIAYLSLSGILHQISFSVFTIEENCQISFVSSTRSLVNRENIHTLIDSVANSAVLFGGIEYKKKYNDIELLKMDSIGKENSLSSYLRTGFNNLEYTGIEVDSIYDVLKENNWRCDIFKGSFATKSSFQDLTSSSVDLIHLATHGFYYPIHQSYRVSEMLYGSSDFSSTINNPLMRSGLVFAPSNASNISDQTIEGVLTSYEISKLNLSNVDFAVLSACETGIGEIRGYEGVYGLQRGFKLAGVNRIIISLWKVPDKETEYFGL